jgi:Gram-negative bacterial TonB protein C-terminal
MFRAFLDQGLERRQRVPRRIRAHAVSLGLHALGLAVLLLLAAQRLDPPEPETATPGLVVSLFQPLAFAGGPAPGTATGAAPPAPAPATSRRRPGDRAPAAPSPLPLDDGGALPLDGSDADGDGTATQVLWMGSGGGRDGQGTGGAGDGTPGTIGRGRRPPELFGRVIGSGLRRGAAVRGDLPFVSLKEATSLRTHDHFPRLPAALWPDHRPYLVALQVCVTAEGRVGDAALMSHGSARLDPIVLQAVRGWRYRPRLQDGQPGPFCHGILIKYEIAY